VIEASSGLFWRVILCMWWRLFVKKNQKIDAGSGLANILRTPKYCRKICNFLMFVMYGGKPIELLIV
jgi:hypothetical protein